MNSKSLVFSGLASLLPDGFDAGPISPAQLLCGTDEQSVKSHINQRGIRYKDRASRLAIASAGLALRQAGLDGAAADGRCAVVTASCFGNVDTVVRVARQLQLEGSMSLSPMDLPNASANVISATLAIWFKLGGPNLFLASGCGSGLEAFHLACNLVRSGRADRVLVCAVEASQPELAAWFGAGQGGPMPIDAGGAVVIESGASFAGRNGDDCMPLLLFDCRMEPASHDSRGITYEGSAAHADTVLDGAPGLYATAGLHALHRAVTVLAGGMCDRARISVGAQQELTLWRAR